MIPMNCICRSHCSVIGIEAGSIPDERRLLAGRILAVDADNESERVLAIDTHFYKDSSRISNSRSTKHTLGLPGRL